jgi:predicted MFS family arabinose efflux permease
MDVTNPKIGAAQYSLLMAFGNAGEMGGTAASGSLITSLGYNRVFLYSGLIYGPALLVLRFIKSKFKNKDS